MVGAPKEWFNAVPTAGRLVLDYSSAAVLPAGTQAMKDNELDAFLKAKVAHRRTGKMSGPDCICRLREASVFLQITAAQARDVVALFYRHEERVEAAVILRNRIVDQENLYQLLYSLHMLEQQFFGKRVGPLNLLNMSRPTGRYRLDTADAEHYQVPQCSLNVE
jgi:hypothetical protein